MRSVREEFSIKYACTVGEKVISSQPARSDHHAQRASPHRLWFCGEPNLNPASLETQCLEETLLPGIESACTLRISSWDARGCHNTNLISTGTPVKSCSGVSLVFIPACHLFTNLPSLVLKPSPTRNHHLSFLIQPPSRVLRLKGRWRFLQSTGVPG